LILLGAVLYFIVNPSNFDGNVTNYVQLSIAAGSEMDAAQIMGAYKANLLTLVFTAPVMDIINAFGVEWGFRAYLLPKLYKKFGTLPSFFMTSLAYGIWYAPLISLGYFYGKDWISGNTAIKVDFFPNRNIRSYPDFAGKFSFREYIIAKSL